MNGGDDLIGGDQGMTLQICRIWHRHIFAGAIDHRRVQIVKGALHNHSGKMVANRSNGEAFFHRDAAVGFLNRGQHRIVIDRPQGAQINHFGAYALLCQFISRF